MTTIGQMKALDRDIGNAVRLAALLDARKNLPGHLASSPFTVFTVRPLTQELFLPHTIPENGELSGEMKIAATRGEYENGSAIVFAFRPTEIGKVSVTDLTGPGGKIIPAKNIDVKLVKRWFRSGGAWLSYHTDRRQRNLTPDLLVNDDNLIRVDEWRRRNYLRLDYPEGRRYVDVSDPAMGHIGWNNNIPFQDADTIQPVKIPEAGRNQQYLFTVHVPENAASGDYRGRISFGGSGVSIDLTVKVLPIDLPTQPSTYYDLEKTFISHLNFLPGAEGPTIPAREEYMRKMLALLRSHNYFDTTGIWDSERLIALSKEAGFIPDKIFGIAGGTSFPGMEYEWYKLYPGVPKAKLTSANKKAALNIIYSRARPWQAYFKKNFPTDAEPYMLFFSENSDYQSLNFRQGEIAEVAHHLGQKVMAHGWFNNLPWAGDIQDMMSTTSLDLEKHAASWHEAGGELISYEPTFPGSENPFWFRRRVGLLTYKAGYDGEMLHGFLFFRTPWNEFAEDQADANFRNFSILYPQKDGFIVKLCFEGCREAFDDLRYATRLRQLALANRDSGDNDLRRESRRQLLWLDALDCKTADPDTARLAIIQRIIILQNKIKKHHGVLPPPDKVAVAKQEGK